MLTKTELQALTGAFPELSWITEADWKAVADHNDWRDWLDEAALNESPRPKNWPDYTGILSRLLGVRRWRVEIRKDCRRYFGKNNVENINDPDDATWA